MMKFSRMTDSLSPMPPRSNPKSSSKFTAFFFSGSLILLLLFLNGMTQIFKERSLNFSQQMPLNPPPLMMEGGDPYIRALMRTISASESNVAQPYHVLYGGEYVKNLNKHPEKCMPIKIGPNAGNCSTAAGRYQMLDFTWAEKAQQYHPQPSQFLRWKSYSFAAEYQDAVVYNWLNDSQVWGIDISQQLRKGNLENVLRHLSGTWTSLGYGIESNSMSSYLPQIYQKMLKEELSHPSSLIKT